MVTVELRRMLLFLVNDLMFERMLVLLHVYIVLLFYLFDIIHYHHGMIFAIMTMMAVQNDVRVIE